MQTKLMTRMSTNISGIIPLLVLRPLSRAGAGSPRIPITATNQNEVVDCRKTKRFGIQYKATFVGNWDEWNSNPPWQPWSDFKHSEDKILEFHRLYPDKPAPPGYFLEHTLEGPRDSSLEGGSVRD